MIAVPEPCRRMIVVLVVPIARGLPIMVIEPRMILIVVILVTVVLIVVILIVAILILSTVLRMDCTAGKGKNKEHATCHQ
jgi:hypothetical protein